MSDSFDFFYSLLHIQLAWLVIATYLGSTIIRISFSYLNFDSQQSLGGKVQFFSPLGFEPKNSFSRKTCKLKSHSGLQDST